MLPASCSALMMLQPTRHGREGGGPAGPAWQLPPLETTTLRRVRVSRYRWFLGKAPYIDDLRKRDTFVVNQEVLFVLVGTNLQKKRSAGWTPQPRKGDPTRAPPRRLRRPLRVPRPRGCLRYRYSAGCCTCTTPKSAVGPRATAFPLYPPRLPPSSSLIHSDASPAAAATGRRSLSRATTSLHDGDTLLIHSAPPAGSPSGSLAPLQRITGAQRLCLLCSLARLLAADTSAAGGDGPGPRRDPSERAPVHL